MDPDQRPRRAAHLDLEFHLGFQASLLRMMYQQPAPDFDSSVQVAELERLRQSLPCLAGSLSAKTRIP